MLKNKPHLVTVHESILVSLWIYIYIYGEMVDFGKSDKMTKAIKNILNFTHI